MQRIITTVTLVGFALLSADARAQFLPKHLAVLRAGDGQLDLHLKQSPIFVDQYALTGPNNAASFTVRIPTNGPDALFFNGHASTEGILTRSMDGRLLAFAGYGGMNLLQSNGAPSLLDIEQGYCTVDASGAIRTKMYRKHGGVEKMNPRGVVTDGTNSFWGCGNAFGTLYYNAAAAGAPVVFKAISSTRSIRIVAGMLYTSLNGPDGEASDLPAGIFSFANSDGNPEALPRSADTALKLVVKADAPYTKNVGFDIAPAGDVAYASDTTAGIQKYVRTNGSWKFAYNISIPHNIPASDNHATGCFGLVVDFSGAAPVIYATTTEGYGGCVNSNRVVRIADTGATSAVTTVAQAMSSKIAFRGIDFTPEGKPAIASQP